MIRTRRRVERLEQAIAPAGVQAEPHVIVVAFVNAKREVVSSFSVEFDQSAPGWNGRGRRAAPRSGGQR
jgi:hypothetical protein